MIDNLRGWQLIVSTEEEGQIIIVVMTLGICFATRIAFVLILGARIEKLCGHYDSFTTAS